MTWPFCPSASIIWRRFTMHIVLWRFWTRMNTSVISWWRHCWWKSGGWCATRFSSSWGIVLRFLSMTHFCLNEIKDKLFVQFYCNDSTKWCENTLSMTHFCLNEIRDKLFVQFYCYDSTNWCENTPFSDKNQQLPSVTFARNLKFKTRDLVKLIDIIPMCLNSAWGLTTCLHVSHTTK